MADQQQRFIVNKFPVKWAVGIGEATVRVDTVTGKTWVLVGTMHADGQGHTFKWKAVEDLDLPKPPTLPAGV